LKRLDGDKDLDKINEIFGKCTGIYDRKDFVKEWINQPAGGTIGYYDSNHQLLAFGVIRLSAGGFRIGPLFIVSQKDKEEEGEKQNRKKRQRIGMKIIKELGRVFAMPTNAKLRELGWTRPISIDVPDCNEEAVELIRDVMLWKVNWRTARMYIGKPLNESYKDYVYGLTSWEFGP